MTASCSKCDTPLRRAQQFGFTGKPKYCLACFENNKDVNGNPIWYPFDFFESERDG
jgi:hypothetical protein